MLKKCVYIYDGKMYNGFIHIFIPSLSSKKKDLHSSMNPPVLVSFVVIVAVTSSVSIPVYTTVWTKDSQQEDLVRYKKIEENPDNHNGYLKGSILNRQWKVRSNSKYLINSRNRRTESDLSKELTVKSLKNSTPVFDGDGIDSEDVIEFKEIQYKNFFRKTEPEPGICTDDKTNEMNDELISRSLCPFHWKVESVNYNRIPSEISEAVLDCEYPGTRTHYSKEIEGTCKEVKYRMLTRIRPNPELGFVDQYVDVRVGYIFIPSEVGRYVQPMTMPPRIYR